MKCRGDPHLQHRSDPNWGKHNDLRPDPGLNLATFRYFGRLPPELRLTIWTMAFDDVDPAVVCLCPNAVPPPDVVAAVPALDPDPTVPIITTIARRHGNIGGGGVNDGGAFQPPVAVAHAEARCEWRRQTCSAIDHPGPANAFYPSRTIFLTHTFVLTQCRVDDMAPFVSHIAIAVVDGPDILRIFEVLAALPQLKTIVLIISATLTDRQLGQWQEKLGEKLPGLLARLAALVDGPSLDGELDERSLVGWLLRNRLEGDETRRFYRRADSPRIKLLVYPPEECSRQDRERDEHLEGGQRWSLVFF